MARHFLTGEELTPAELRALVERALELKADRGASRTLAGRSVALVFERPSTRTRVSFEVGVGELGGQPVVLREAELQRSRGESARDTALVLSRLVHAVGVRTGAHEGVEELAAYAEVPVINLLTHAHHPCQALADLVTLRERFGTLAGLKLAYVGDGNNVARSLVLLAPRVGVEVAVASPPELSLPGLPALLPEEAVEDAHAVYTDVWVSIGDDDEAERRRELLRPYRVDAALLGRARPDAVALHCLPAHPGEEITAEVLYGERSAAWDQAENRLHAQKALLELLVG
ncbi:MAG: ornithine carbamoyltransferase [Nocardioidaceae bacterium]